MYLEPAQYVIKNFIRYDRGSTCHHRQNGPTVSNNARRQMGLIRLQLLYAPFA